MRALLTAASLALLALPGAAMAGERVKLTGEEKLSKMLEGRVAGKPVRCLTSHLLRDSTVIDKTAIVYRDGRTLYVNRPTSGVEQLDDDDILVTKIYGTQLCNVDKVDLVDRSSRMWNGFVLLGDFVPYDKVRTSAR